MLIDNVIKMLVSSFIVCLSYVTKQHIASYKIMVRFDDDSKLLMKGDLAYEENEIVEKEK